MEAESRRERQHSRAASPGDLIMSPAITGIFPTASSPMSHHHTETSAFSFSLFCCCCLFVLKVLFLGFQGENQSCRGHQACPKASKTPSPLPAWPPPLPQPRAVLAPCGVATAPQGSCGPCHHCQLRSNILHCFSVLLLRPRPWFLMFLQRWRNGKGWHIYRTQPKHST